MVSKDTCFCYNRQCRIGQTGRAGAQQPSCGCDSGATHGALDVQSLDILPVLLQQGNQRVDGNLDVGVDLLLGELNVGDGNSDGQDLLQLELDVATDVINLVGDGFGALQEGWELTKLVHGRSKKTRDLLHDSLGGKESIELVCCKQNITQLVWHHCAGRG